MKKFMKCIMLGMLGMALIFSVSTKGEASSVDKKVVSVNESDHLITARIVMPESEVFAAVTYGAENGRVDGSGVRLRAKPSSTATILELMYNNELVRIDGTGSVLKGGIYWYYLKRLKTGTWGYADSQYIEYFE